MAQTVHRPISEKVMSKLNKNSCSLFTFAVNFQKYSDKTGAWSRLFMHLPPLANVSPAHSTVSNVNADSMTATSCDTEVQLHFA